MDEASGCCGLLMVALVLVLVVAAFFELRREPAPAEGPGVVGAAEPPERPRFDPFHWWPLGPRATLVAIGLLYGAGLFLIRPRAIRARRRGASNQQAALIALTSFALSPVVVPATAAWWALGALGDALTSRGVGDRSPGDKPRGFDDLE